MTATVEAPDTPGADHGEAGHTHTTSTGITNEKLSMWVFLGSECLLFGGLISTYLLYRNRVPGSQGPKVADIFDQNFTSVSSLVLLMSSLTMVLAVAAARRDDSHRTRTWLMTTALLGATFVAGQIYEFTVFYREGLGFTTNLGGSAFYSLTGFHGVHVSLGVVMLLSLVAISLRGKMSAETVDIIGLYWHFVDVVWIVIFTIVYLIPE